MRNEFIELEVKDSVSSPFYKAIINIDHIISIENRAGTIILVTHKRSYYLSGKYEDIVAELA